MSDNVTPIHREPTPQEIDSMLNDLILDQHHESIRANRPERQARYARLIRDHKARKARQSFRIVS